MSPKNREERYGLLVATLDDVRPDAITVADETFYLRKGMRCAFPVGTRVEVWYSEREGRKEVDKIVKAALAD